MDRIPMQTLQIYRKPDKTPSDKRFKKIEEELREVRIKFPMPVEYRHPEKVIEERKLVENFIEPPRIKGIELQNKLRRIENQLNFWVNDYRNLIDEVRELDRLLPKNRHNLQESEDEAHENVLKIKKILDIKERVLDEYRSICIRHEDCEENSKKLIKKLETDLGESQAKVECLEYDIKRLKKHVETQ